MDLLRYTVRRAEGTEEVEVDPEARAGGPYRLWRWPRPPGAAQKPPEITEQEGEEAAA